MVIVTVLAINLIVLPVEQAFFHRYDLRSGWLAFNLISSVFYLLDIVINLLSGTVKPEGVCLDRQRIICAYLRTWFFIDLLGALPLDVIFRACGNVSMFTAIVAFSIECN